VQTLSAQLGWSHFLEIIPFSGELQRDFYAEMCPIERWSVRTLRDKVRSMLYELLQLNRGRIRVAEYLTELPPRHVLEAKLHEAINMARAQLAARAVPQ